METTSTSSLTPSSSSSHISLSSTLSLPKSCSKHINSKIKNLVEYSYIPESAQINESQFPVMSTYNLYKQKTSFTRSIRTLISTKRPLPKEYIQSSRLDQKGLPVTARIALLDTRFKQYQHAVIGTILTTLHAGSVLLTFYPNFNLSLEDPNLPTTIKVQIQLQGAEQTPTSKIATLHHQIVYRLQNHALDLPTPDATSDGLIILADTDTIPTIIQIPKQIQKEELLTLMPLEWLTNYEQFHQNSEPEKNLPIHGFSSEGYPVYPDKINGHFLWDVPKAHMCNPDCPCLDDTDVDDELEVMKRKKKKKNEPSHPKTSCKSFPPQPPPDLKPPLHPIRPQPPVYNQFFGFSHLQPTPQPKPSSPKKSKSKSKVKISEPTSKATLLVPPVLPEDSPKATLEPPKKDKGPMDQYHYHTIQNTSSDSSEPETVYESNPSESNPSSSSFSTNSGSTSTNSESKYDDITSIFMATKTEDPSASTATPIVEVSSSDAENQAAPTELEPSMPPPVPNHSTKPSSASWFTFDDIPRHKWPTHLQEFTTWIDLQGTKPNAHPKSVLREFMARSTGSLRDWLATLGEYRQIQFMQSLIGTALNIIHEQFIVQNVNQVSTIPRPSLKMSILPSKFHKPVPVIGFIDTGVDTSMIDPSILPSDCWENHSKLFRDVNGETFETTLITKKPIGIQFFPNCIIWKKIVASTLRDKDLLIGFDILHLVKNLFITSSGIRYKHMFLPYTDMLRLYTLSDVPTPYSHISQKLLEYCPENHSQFYYPFPLWKNEQFFIHLPFKLNEDINPTKASHPSMSPSDLLLAKQECSQLLQQGLIEPIDSDWACKAFYVEKRSELVRGKKRLVIDYQPLNSFLKDDKFPLPKIQTLFVHLQGAHIFSKFDLKAGFWQLGISPVDRPKTAFCNPDAQYLWTVKVAPSLFQKAMTKILSPILHHALVYIDDILLFSSDHDSHQKLLLDFFHIVQVDGIMLSEKKSSIAKESIDFLGIVITNGHYQPSPHIATELLKFPNTNLTKKQIQ
ncbi:hypothetical protein KPL71_011965 [Citrus sinensis]|uniref:Uncharacterized protein n=1 Tax=Citrus sinensis TaxID=2711 RepID=A0ACB8L815_CITSI|nr:hypothetical protein KPL71_011965 [Citrus sinensis]